MSFAYIVRSFCLEADEFFSAYAVFGVNILIGSEFFDLYPFLSLSISVPFGFLSWENFVISEISASYKSYEC